MSDDRNDMACDLFPIQITIFTVFLDQSESESGMAEREPGATDADVPNGRRRGNRAGSADVLPPAAIGVP